MKNKRLLKKSEIYFLLFFQLLELKHLTKGFKLHARFRLQKKEFTDQKFKVLRTQTFSHVIGCNIKFKTRAYEKIKTTEGFPSSLAFIFCTLFVFVRKETRKVMIKNSRL